MRREALFAQKRTEDPRLDPSDYFAVAAYLAHPYQDIPDVFRRKLEEDSFDFNLLYSTLKENKVLFRTLAQITSSSSCLSLKRSILKRFVDEKEIFQKSHEFLRFLKGRILQVVEVLEDNNIESIFLKSFNSLPVDSDNFDILVEDAALSTACESLKSLGYVEVAWVKEPYKRLFRKVRNAEDCLAIHLHTRMAWDGIEFVDHSDLWGMRQEKKIDGVTVGFPSHEHHMLITSAHAFFENHCFKLGDLIYTIEDSRLQKKTDWNYLEQWVSTCKWSVPFYVLLQFQDHLHESLFTKKMFENKDFRAIGEKKTAEQNKIVQRLVAEFSEKRALPIPIPVLTVSRYYVKKILSDPKLPLTRRVCMVAPLFGQYAGRRIFGEKHPTLLIAFSGQDGTGKTTHARHLWNELQDRGIKTDYIWSRGMGLSFEPFLRLARKFLLGRVHATDDDIYQIKREKTLNIKPMGLLWAYLTVVDHLFQIMTKVRTSLLLNNVVICDRYIYDTLADARCYVGQTARLVAAKRSLEIMIPSPTVTFLMENQQNEYLENHSLMKPVVAKAKGDAQVNFLPRKDLVIIDTTKPTSENALEILSTVLSTYYSRK
jgi:thymidylate kinase